jgi:Domain of unknown function (DUF4113)
VLLERVHRLGLLCHKAGIFLTDIVADAERRQDLLLRIDDERLRLMKAVDRINRKHGCYSVHPLAMWQDRGRVMRRGRMSGRYTMGLDEVLKVKAF